MTMTINDTIDYYDDNQLGLVNGINNDFSLTVDKYSCWCILFIDEGTKYVNKTVDASDVICCIVKPSDLLKYERQAAHLSFHYYF
jgi:hypothetical protein